MKDRQDSAFFGRREDDRLLRGAGKYTSDWSLPGQSYAAFLRSNIAHAKIVGVDVGAARASHGVLEVLTGTDMIAAGYSRVPPHLPVQGRSGALKAPRCPALAADRVRYMGEPIALVVATTEFEAQNAVELIEVEFEELEAVASIAAAIAKNAGLVHDQIPGNICFDHEYGDPAAVDNAFQGAAHMARIGIKSSRLVANPMEPKAALVEWEGDLLKVVCPSQGVTALREGLCAATGLPADQVLVVAEDVGGAFGVRGDAYPEYVAMALASRRIGRPVKWTASRSETFVSDMHGRSIGMSAELALDATGRFLGIRHDWVCDAGAHPSGSGPLTAVFNSTLMACGAYRIPAVAGRTRIVVTNLVPISAYRGAARPEMAYAVERLVDEAARVTGIDRVELRRRNLIPEGDFPFKVDTAVFPSAYDSADFAGLIDSGLAAANWYDFPARRAASAVRGRLRGIGCGLFIEPAGGVAPSDEGAVTFSPDGDVMLDQVSQSSGQGYETVFPEIVARVLQIVPSRITLRFPSSHGPAQKGGGAFASRSLMSQGSVLDQAARVALGKARTLAAAALQADEHDLDYAEGTFYTRHRNRFVGLAELAREHPGALDAVAELPSPRCFPSGFHVAEVEIDPETGATDLIDYISVDDCGTVINETLVRGQILGGLAQGLGQVFGEACAYDSDGQLLSGSFMDYAMPRADLVGPVKLIVRGVPSPTNRLGAKGVGEAGTVGAMPAAMNAILDALSTARVTRFDLPATPHRIWQVIREAKEEPLDLTGKS